MKTDYTYRAFCHSCYDGDTFTMTIDLGFNVQVTEKIRLFGVDTPEIRGDERERGLLVRVRQHGDRRAGTALSLWALQEFR